MKKQLIDNDFKISRVSKKQPSKYRPLRPILTKQNSNQEMVDQLPAQTITARVSQTRQGGRRGSMEMDQQNESIVIKYGTNSDLADLQASQTGAWVGSTQLSSRAQSTMRSTRRRAHASLGIDKAPIDEQAAGSRRDGAPSAIEAAVTSDQFSQRQSINHQFNKEVLMDTPLELQLSKFQHFRKQHDGLFATERLERGRDGAVRPGTQGSPLILRLNNVSRNR